MALNDLTGNAGQPLVPGVRTEPTQERGAARIDALLDAAALVVDEVGLDRLTTAMVAEKASSSIGTVYRYFPDRIALLQGLRDRAVLRYRHAVVEQLGGSKPNDWADAVAQSLEAFAGMFRSEPGFKIIRFIDETRVRNQSAEEYSAGHFARIFAAMLSEEYGLTPGKELNFRLTIAVEIGLSLVERAFLNDQAGDEAIIAEAKAVVLSYLAGYYSSAA